MRCDYAVTFKNRGPEEDPGDELVEYVANRLRGMGFEAHASLGVGDSAQPPGVSGSVDAEEPQAAAAIVCEAASRSLRHLGKTGWNVMCGAWPHQNAKT